MKVVMQLERKYFKQGDIIFEVNHNSDGLYLINSGEVSIVSKKGVVLATLSDGELFGEMSAIVGDRLRKSRAIVTKDSVIDKIDSKSMQKKLEDADPVLRALVRTLTYRLTAANDLNERLSLQLDAYRSLSPDEIESGIDD